MAPARGSLLCLVALAACPGDTPSDTDAPPDTSGQSSGQSPTTGDPTGSADVSTTGPADTTSPPPTTDETTQPLTSDATTSTSATDETTSVEDSTTTDTTTDTTTADETTDTTDTTGGQPLCGDGVVEGDEACDAGQDNGPGAACNADCVANVCGDGDKGPGEACDDGNQVDADGCDGDCSLASCGDGRLDVGEACDDGKDGDNTDDCTDLCLLPVCGDGFVQAGEACDAGPQNSDTAACTAACAAADCGDGLVWAGVEACDDGNAVDADDCTNLCTLPPDTDCDGAFAAGEYCFAPTGLQLMLSSPRFSLAADLDGDGVDDLAIAETSPQRVHVRVSDGAGGFDGGTNFPVPDGAPTGLAAADIDADGDLDLAIASPGGVTLMTNLGNAKFIVPAPALTTTAAPAAIVAADLDGDGDPDIATADTASAGVSVRWGAAAATFSAPLVLRASFAVSDLVAVDVDVDGLRDLVAVNKAAATVSVLRNLGNRQFARQRTYRVPLGAGALALGDLDGDTRPDLVVPDKDIKGLYVRRGTAQGTFDPAAYHVRLGVVATDLTLADINHDGDLDVVALHAGGVAVATGAGDGQFAGAVQFPVAPAPNHVAVGDLDGDGRRDLAVAIHNAVRVMWSDPDADSPQCQGICHAATCGDGVVTPQVEACDDGNTTGGDGCEATCQLPAPTGCGNLIAEPGELCFTPIPLPHKDQNWDTMNTTIASGDLDGDGAADLVLAHSDAIDGLIENYSKYGEVYETWLATGEGGLEQREVKEPIGCLDNPRTSVITDYNSDGKGDLILNCIRTNPLTPNKYFIIAVFLGNGNGTLQGSSATKNWSDIYHSTIADVDKDGDLDVVMGDSGSSFVSYYIYYNRGVGLWGDQNGVGGPRSVGFPEFGSSGSDPIPIADFNADGFIDIFAPGQHLILGGPANALGPAVKSPAAFISRPVVADYNHDGVLDLANYNSNGQTARIFLGDGGGLFGPFAAEVSTGLQFLGLDGEARQGGGDFDADGHPDMVVASSKNEFSILRGNGGPAFLPAQKFTGTSAAHALHIRDADGDGRLDLYIGGKNQTVLLRSNP